MADDPYDYDFTQVRDYFLSRLRAPQLLPMFERTRREYPAISYASFCFWSDQGRERSYSVFQEEAARLEAKLRADSEVVERLDWLTELGFHWRFMTSSEFAGGHWFSFDLDLDETAEKALLAHRLTEDRHG